jgi:amidase
MTKNITDSGILLSAMSGQDRMIRYQNSPQNIQYLDHLKTGTLKGLRFGAIKTFLEIPSTSKVSIPSLSWCR